MIEGNDGITELDKMDYVDSSGVHEEPEPEPPTGKQETYLSLESQVKISYKQYSY
jgi:hypothetical protein